MNKDIKTLEREALKYARIEIDNKIIKVRYVCTYGARSYFEPYYKPFLVSSTGGIHLITFENDIFGVTYDENEIKMIIT